MVQETPTTIAKYIHRNHVRTAFPRHHEVAVLAVLLAKFFLETHIVVSLAKLHVNVIVVETARGPKCNDKLQNDFSIDSVPPLQEQL